MSTPTVEEVPSAASLENFGGRKRAVDDSWKKIQERVFKNWMNDRLRGNLKVAQRQVSETEQQHWTAFSCWSPHPQRALPHVHACPAQSVVRAAGHCCRAGIPVLAPCSGQGHGD